ncbi:hypothetical protein F9802_13990 [Bacillus aerolatus]|uniref:Uncharacterized protein n=1 Tax=Bacillus aerolatus TaxID=2653354 RepID=A0A6I1FIX1_9BACI|nr:hypothetical protein [Bacillus aerolatus]KAB7705636.1 hypothetical protein F9802_13990 [Bacillus aerolatus]
MEQKVKGLTGEKIGKWTVVEFSYSAANEEGRVVPHLRVACECGTSKILSIEVLRSGDCDSESCGCIA